MKCNYLENLSSNAVKSDDFLNTTNQVAAIPSSVKTKGDLIRWRESEHTKHVFWSPYEGVMGNIRVSKKGDNDAFTLHGFVADYDQVLNSDQQMLDSIARNQSPDYPVTYASRSFSGGAHVVWEFEKPVNIINPRMLEGFLKTFCSRAKVNKILGGFDDMSLTPNLYYTMNPNWHKLAPAPIKDSLAVHPLHGRHQHEAVRAGGAISSLGCHRAGD